MRGKIQVPQLEDEPFATANAVGAHAHNEDSKSSQHPAQVKRNDYKRKEDAVEAIISKIEVEQGIITDKDGQVWLVIPPINKRNGSTVVLLTSKEANQYYNRLYKDLTGLPSRLPRNQLKVIAENLEDTMSRSATVYRRWAMIKNSDNSFTLWHDLNRPDRIGVRVTSEGWKLVPLTDILFIYNREAEESPVPVKTDIPFIQFMDKHLPILEAQDRMILAAVLVSYILASKLNVITVLKGIAGSGKSSIARFLGLFMQYNSDREGLIDGATKFTDDQLMARLANQAYLSFDNTSSLSSSDSDALCRISTGTAMSVRRFYTETGLVTVARSAPVILTTVYDLGGKPDFQDRAYFFTPKPNTLEHKDESILWDEIYRDYPEMLGALYDLASFYLKHIGEATRITSRQDLPRMSGFALVGVAITSELNKGEYKFSSFPTELSRKRTNAAYNSIDNDKLTLYIYQFLKDLTEETITLTPKELTDEINRRIKRDDPKSKARYSHLHMIRNLLQRIPTLRDCGIEFEIQEGQYAGRAKSIILKKIPGVFVADAQSFIEQSEQESELDDVELVEEDNYDPWDEDPEIEEMYKSIAKREENEMRELAEEIAENEQDFSW